VSNAVATRRKKVLNREAKCIFICSFEFPHLATIGLLSLIVSTSESHGGTVALIMSEELSKDCATVWRLSEGAVVQESATEIPTGLVFLFFRACVLSECNDQLRLAEYK